MLSKGNGIDALFLKNYFLYKHWPSILGGSRCGMTSQFVQRVSLHTMSEIQLSWSLFCTEIPLGAS